MITKRLCTLFAGIAMLPAAFAQYAAPEKVFEEEFDRYPEQPEIFHADSHINEHEASKKDMDFHPTKMGDLRKKPYDVAGAPENFDLLFQFKFKKDSKRAFSFLLFFKDPDQKNPKAAPLRSRVSISEKGSGLDFWANPGFPRPGRWSTNSLGALPAFPDNYWHNARLSVRGGYGELYIQRNGRWFLESRGYMVKPGAILTGFNIASDTQVGLDAIEIIKIDKNIPAPAAIKSFPFDGDQTAFEVKGVSYPASFTMTLADGSEKPAVVTFNGLDETRFTRTVVGKNETIKEKVPLRDAGYNVGFQKWNGVSAQVRTRPNLSRYTTEGKAEMAERWETFPAASAVPLCIRLKKSGENVYELWLNEKLAFPITLTAPLKEVKFMMPDGTVNTVPVLSTKNAEKAGFLPLDPVAILDWSPLAAAKKQHPSTLSETGGIPFISNPLYKFPLSVCEENLGTFYLECDGYLSRSAFDGMPSSVHFSVPTAQYTKAYALCTVDYGARSDMVPVITARITNFAHPKQGRAEGICHCSVTLPAKPGDPLPSCVKVVGGTEKAPLYLVEFSFDTGSIEDVVFREDNPQMDFELLGELYWKDNYYVNHAMKPSTRKSSVVVHAATLKNTPAELRVDQGRPGATWYLEEKPWYNVHVKPLQSGKYTYTTKIFDVRGKQLSEFTGTTDAEKDFRIDIPQKEYGWYRIQTVLADAKGTALVIRDSAFVLLPPDTRKAGMESPYHAWYIAGAHITPMWDIWSDLAVRQGTRRATYQLKSEENVKPLVFTLGQFPSPASKFKTEAEAEKMIKDWTTKFPHCKAVVIFHESLHGPYPMELIGGKTELSPEQIEKDKQYLEKALFMTKMWRKYAPDVKLVVGNSGASLGGLARLFRQKFPRELIDKMGEESCGMTTPPEFSTAMADWSLKRLAEIYGYKDLMPTGTYEWKCRNSRDIEPVKLAAFGMRDNLIAHAWHHDLLSGGGSSCPANSYWNTIWCGGSYTRYPLLEPQPGVAAISTMTLVLDCAKATRMIPTGSHTVYVLEFKRGNEFIYAYWTARGNVSADFTFDKAAQFTRTEMLGKASAEKTGADGKFATVITEEPAYVTTTVPLKSVSAAMKRDFPNEKRPAGTPELVSAMDDASAWTTVKGVDSRILVGENRAPFFHGSDFEIKTVKDEEKGNAIELTLAKGECPELVQETGFIKLKEPILVNGEPNTIGVSVKGNSSWGKIFFEFTDAEGEVWLSAGNGGFGCDVYDWPCSVAMNYDGWNELVFPITAKSSIKVKSPGENEWQWQRTGNGNGLMDYPIKITGIGYTMFRSSLVIDHMEKVEPVIRFRDLKVWK